MSRHTSCSRPVSAGASCIGRGFAKGLRGGEGTGAGEASASFADGILLVLIRPPDVVVAALGNTLGSLEEEAEAKRSILGISCVDLEPRPTGDQRGNVKPFHIG